MAVVKQSVEDGGGDDRIAVMQFTHSQAQMRHYLDHRQRRVLGSVVHPVTARVPTAIHVHSAFTSQARPGRDPPESHQNMPKAVRCRRASTMRAPESVSASFIGVVGLSSCK